MNAPSRENAAEAKKPDVDDESVAAPETRSALIQFAADVIRLRTNGEPLKGRESEALDSRLCDLGMAMRAEADRITAAIRGSVAAPVAAQPEPKPDYRTECWPESPHWKPSAAALSLLDDPEHAALAAGKPTAPPEATWDACNPVCAEGYKSERFCAGTCRPKLAAQSAPPAEPVAQPAKYVPLTMEAIWDAADEAGLDWHMGFSIGDDTQEDNRYAKLVRAVESAVVQRMQGASPPAVSAEARDAARWRRWAPYMRGVSKMPFNLIRELDNYFASMAGTTPAGKENGK